MIFSVGLIYSKALLSISLGGFLLYALWLRRSTLLHEFRGFAKAWPYVGLTLVFVVYVLAGIHTADTDQWLKQVRIKLPFLLLPLSFYLIRSLTERQFKFMHAVIAGLSMISAVPVLWYYYQHKAELIAAIGHGQSIPTPIDHIHYSIILAYSSCVLLLLLADGCLAKSRLEHWLYSGLAAGVAVVLHILAVRSGLAIFYLGLAFVVVWYVYSSRQYVVGGIGLLLLLSAPYVMYKTVPSLHKKVSYMMYDIQQYRQGNGNNFSDSERLMSYTIAADLIRQQPLVGHGIGDLEPLMVAEHKARYGEKEKYIYPHNQYLYVLVGAGFLGFIFFFGGLLSPVVFMKPDPYIWLTYIAMLAAFMVENTLERAVSVAFFLVVLLYAVGRSRGCAVR